MIVDIAVGETHVLKLLMEPLAQCSLKRQVRFLIQARKRVSNTIFSAFSIRL